MLAIAISIGCLFLNAVFVAAEFAIVKLRVTQLRSRLQRRERRAVAAAAVLSKLDRYLSVTQVGITLASLGLGWVGEPAVERFGDRLAIAITGSGLGPTGHVVIDVVGLATLTLLHVLVGELVPKAIAIRHSESTALTTAIPLQVANTIFAPVLWLLERAQTVLLRALGVNPEMTEGSLSEEEIVGILAANASSHRAGHDRQRTIERVLRFASRPVRHIMVPRVDIVALPVDCTGEEALARLQEHQFSRVPLYRGTIDDIVGYLYAKEFLLQTDAPRRPSLEGFVRRTLFVPENRDGLAVLRDMQRERVPLVVVVDEYGGTSGIVTIEDLVEEVFGDIRDELDAEPERIVRLRGRTPAWEVDARVTVDDLREAGLPVDQLGSAGTIGRLVLQRLGHLPHAGDSVPLGDRLLAEIVSASRRRIGRLRIRTTVGAEQVGAAASAAP